MFLAHLLYVRCCVSGNPLISQIFCRYCMPETGLGKKPRASQVPILLGLHVSEVDGQETNNDGILCQIVISGMEKNKVQDGERRWHFREAG